MVFILHLCWLAAHTNTLIVLAASQRRSMINTINCRYSNCLLMMNSYSIRNMYRTTYWNKLRKKIASCWSLLRMITLHSGCKIQIFSCIYNILLVSRALSALVFKGWISYFGFYWLQTWLIYRCHWTELYVSVLFRFSMLDMISKIRLWLSLHKQQNVLEWRTLSLQWVSTDPLAKFKYL